jgi:hypothetical protein
MADQGKMSEKQLALWMLNKMRDSEQFLGVIRAARRGGGRDVLDTPDYVARHKKRLAKLYQDSDEETVETPAGVAAKVEHLGKRDLMSCREELIEKALAAYLGQHARGAEGLPKDWRTTFSLAEAEIEGRTSGAFQPGFVAQLADMARQEMAKEAAKTRDRSRGGREG